MNALVRQLIPWGIFGFKKLNVNIVTKEYLQDIAFCSPLVKNNKKVQFYNIPCAFDIEVSSFYSNQLEKVAIMYEWTFGIYDTIIIGRTWEEFESFIEMFIECFELSENKHILCFVHNLAYEFQFLSKRFNWDKIFAVRQRKPVQAIYKGLEFRCSYILSGKSLAKLDLNKYKIDKLVGDLDYNLLRHSSTPLTKNEYMYCINDVLKVLAYIQEKIETGEDVTKIPLTKTGYVRNYCRKACFNSKNKRHYSNYRKLMHELEITSHEYELALKAFQGGFTHANAWYTGKVLYNVSSYDFTSSYPYVMVSETFPMTRGIKYTPKSIDDFLEKLQTHACIIELTIYDLECDFIFEHPISFSRCYNCSITNDNMIIDNGRVVRSDKITMTITEVDFQVYRKFYKFSHFELHNMYIYKKAYLPTNLVKAIVDLYEKKTVLKGVKGMELDYLLSKEYINSVYGMCVTNIIQPENVFDGIEWESVPVNIEEAIEKHNNSKKRFLFYLWGVYVTAYARKNLFTGIYECKEDYIYSDTDSLKVINIENHVDYFKAYNKNVEQKLKLASEHHKIPFEKFAPKTKNDEIKMLGVWDYEGQMDFKTLGAKRYMVRDKNGYNMTVSGLNKKVAVPYLLSKSIQENKSLFEMFNDDLYIPVGFTGKNTHTYIDEQRQGICTDYLGSMHEYNELSSIHMEACDYHLSLASQYVDFILGLREEERL